MGKPGRSPFQGTQGKKNIERPAFGSIIHNEREKRNWAFMATVMRPGIDKSEGRIAIRIVLGHG